MQHKTQVFFLKRRLKILKSFRMRRLQKIALICSKLEQVSTQQPFLKMRMNKMRKGQKLSQKSVQEIQKIDVDRKMKNYKIPTNN